MLQDTWQCRSPGQEFWVSASLADWLPTADPFGSAAGEFRGPALGRVKFPPLRALLWQHLKPKHSCRWAGNRPYSIQLEMEIHLWGGSNLSWIINWKNCKASSLSWSKLLYSARRDLSMQEVFQCLLFLDVSLTVAQGIKCCFFPIHRVGSWDACSWTWPHFPDHIDWIRAEHLANLDQPGILPWKFAKKVTQRH